MTKALGRNEYLYFSAVNTDTQPTTATTYRRDDWSDRDDQIAIAIDSFNDFETQSAFVLYSTEARIDAQFTDDGREQNAANTDWNTFWDGKVSRSDFGWQAEVRIPWWSLRFETPKDGDFNAVLGVDGVLNVVGDDLIRFGWAQSFETGEDNSLASGDNTRYRLLIERARSTGFLYSAGIGGAGASYRPGVGFQLRENYLNLNSGLGYGWQSEADTRLQSWSVGGRVDGWYERSQEQFGTVQAELEWSAEFSSQYNLTGRVTLEHENLVKGFSLSDAVEIPAGEYTFVSTEIGIETPGGNALKTETQIRVGRFFDGTQVVAAVSPLWSITEGFAINGTYEYSRLRFSDRGQSFDAHLLQGRADLMLSTRVTFSAFLQYNSAADAVLVNGRFRFNPREGNDFYLVYNEGLNTDRSVSSPRLPYSSGRTILAKYTYTFSR